MILWTIQHYSAYERMLETGVLIANESHLFCQDDFRHAYDWMARIMIEAIYAQLPIAFIILYGHGINGKEDEKDGI